METLKNWIEIEFDDKEYDNVWDRFYRKFNFNPSTYKEDWPSFRIEAPFITYDISHIYNNPEFEKLHNDLEEKVIMALRACAQPSEYLYALDWQHPCYWFNPWLDISERCHKHPSLGWVIPILPNGDYYIFLQKDFNWGILGHPWEESMCIFGSDLISSIEKNKPLLFSKILRSNLKYIEHAKEFT